MSYPEGIPTLYSLYYLGETVNLVPSLKRINLRNSGTGGVISEIDISGVNSLVSADFSGMTQLNSIKLPVGNTLTSLNLSGNNALLELDLSETQGFIFPEGFKTLTSLRNFTMSNRAEVDSVDLSSFTRLTKLEMTNDSLETLDLSANKTLESLYAANNRISSLDLSNNVMLTNIDVSNNNLTKIDLYRNMNLVKTTEYPMVLVSGQVRKIDGAISNVFDFRRVGIQTYEFTNIVADSIKGDNVKAESFDPHNGTAVFSFIPSVIEYEYRSGIYYSTTEPVCMNVRLLLDISGQVPFISLTTAEITVSADAGPIKPVIITAYSNSPVTWISNPETMPAGLEKITDSWTFTISGEPKEAYSGTVIVTARNENGNSESATVKINIVSEDNTPEDNTPEDNTPEDNTPKHRISASGGGCNSGFAVTVIAVLALIFRKKD